MIDYYAHLAVLNSVSKALAALNDAKIGDQRDNLLGDAAAYPEAALLGSMVDHVFMHAESTGAELEILAAAADCWTRARAMYDSVGEIRTKVQAAFENPAAPDATSRMNVAMSSLKQMKPQLAILKIDMDVIGADVTSWRHLPQPHPRQQDKSIEQWPWGDRFLARRTDAFVRATFSHAQNRRGNAFALGVLASYAGNVAGSAYLGHVVGGPRRSHPRRDRVARNTVGVWLRAHYNLPTLEVLEASIGLNTMAGAAYALRPDITSLLQAALDEAFPDMPEADLALGFTRLRQHLALLQVFVLPPDPTPIPAILLASMPPIDSADISYASDQQDPGDEPYGPPPPPGPGSSTGGQPRGRDVDTGDACLIGLAIVTALYFLISGIVALAQGKKWDPFGDLANSNTGSPSEEEDINTTAQQLQTLAASSQGSLMLSQLYDFQLTIWQAMSECMTILAKKGLIYPDELIIGTRPFAQFTALPPATAWPLRNEATVDEAYLDFPSGPVEHPATPPSPLHAGATPVSWTGGNASADGSLMSAPIEAVHLWLQIARSDEDSFNRDLDADRGYGAECWQVAEKTSIKDDPITVEILPYKRL